MRGMEHLQSGGLCQGRENWGQGVKRLEGDSKRVMGVIGKRIYTGKVKKKSVPFSSFTQLCPTLCDPNSLQHAKLPCLSPTPGVYSNSNPLSQ